MKTAEAVPAGGSELSRSMRETEALLEPGFRELVESTAEGRRGLVADDLRPCWGARRMPLDELAWRLVELESRRPDRVGRPRVTS